MKILIIDDSTMERKLLIETLRKGGIQNEILEAADGQAALDIINKEYANICLVFTDWQIPKVDGLEVLKQIAQNPETASLPVVMATSTNSSEDEEIARLLNPNLAAFLFKPLDPKTIVEIALSHIK